MTDLIISPLVCLRYHKVMGKVKKGFGLTGQLKQRKKTHQECRGALCAKCFSKGNLRVITKEVEDMMKAHTPAFSLDNEALPYVICDRCRLLLLYLNKNPGNERNRKLPPAPNYEDMTPPTPLTRNSQDCQCGVCNVSRTQLSQDHKAALSKFIFTSQTTSSSASGTSVS